MNIRAVMAALDDWLLDRTAKQALVAVACRADRHGRCEVSNGRVAADLQVHYRTAARALKRLTDAGYLAVDKRLGATNVWTLTLGTDAHPPLGTEYRGGGHLEREEGGHLVPTEGVFRENQGGATDTDTPHGVPVAPGEKRRAPPGVDPGTWARSWDPARIELCPYCDECGWLERDGGVVRCWHEPRVRVTDLTVEAILAGAGEWAEP